MGRNITTSQLVDASLERWRRMLDDVALLRDMPRIFLDNLLNLSEDLHRRSVIDAHERFDMDEIARAAYDHEMEERLILYRYFRESGSYALMHNGVKAGELRGARIFLGSDTASRRPGEYDARLERTANGLEAITKFMKPIGRVNGKLYLATDEAYELVETSRIIGREIPAIDDPDIYRAALDAIQAAEEQGDAKRHAALSKRASISIFMPCPACDDQFSRREDCEECCGLGFVRETPERFRWRS
jgi:hypothetical protein